MRGDKEREAAATASFLCLSAPLSENNLGIKSKMNQLFSISVTEPALTFIPRRRLPEPLLRPLVSEKGERVSNLLIYLTFKEYLNVEF